MALDAAELKRLKQKARQMREEIVKITYTCGGAHIGGALSQTDILVALYYKYMNIDPKKPDLATRDRFVLSKGHGGIGHAVILGDLGYFDKETLKEFNKTGSPFGMHLDCLKVPGVDASTGSLGHGFSIAAGMALGARLQNKKWRTYVVLGDGELHGGPIWETAMAAAHFKITNMTTIIDRNMLCIDGNTEDIMALEPLKAKWEAFGWQVLEVDGHDFNELCAAIDEANEAKDKPVVIIANTKKGKGVDFMECEKKWHYAGLDEAMMNKSLDSLKKGAK